MRDIKPNRIAFRAGRIVGFALLPAKFLVVAYVAWLAAVVVGGR